MLNRRQNVDDFEGKKSEAKGGAANLSEKRTKVKSKKHIESKVNRIKKNTKKYVKKMKKQFVFCLIRY